MLVYCLCAVEDVSFLDCSLDSAKVGAIAKDMPRLTATKNVYFSCNYGLGARALLMLSSIRPASDPMTGLSS